MDNLIEQYKVLEQQLLSSQKVSNDIIVKMQRLAELIMSSDD